MSSCWWMRKCQRDKQQHAGGLTAHDVLPMWMSSFCVCGFLQAHGEGGLLSTSHLQWQKPSATLLGGLSPNASA